MRRVLTARATSEPELPASAVPAGGGSVPPVELRVARVEVIVEHMERDLADVKADIRSIRHIDMLSLRQTMDHLHRRLDSEIRLVWAAIIASNLGLASLMAKGFGWL